MCILLSSLEGSSPIVLEYSRHRHYVRLIRTTILVMVVVIINSLCIVKRANLKEAYPGTKLGGELTTVMTRLYDAGQKQKPKMTQSSAHHGNDTPVWAEAQDDAELSSPR